jgi:putative hydrolase of the HAD superfamily
MPKRFDAVLLDVGQTLLRVEPSVGHIYADTARAYGIDAAPEVIERAFREFWNTQRREFPDNLGMPSSEEAEREWWRGAVEWVFNSAGLMEAFGPRFEPYFDELFEVFARGEVWHVYDDVVPTLDAFDRAGIRLGVVSNWDKRLGVLLDSLELSRRFEFIVASAGVGRRKPHPRIFEEALRRLELPADRVAHIGDSYEEDILGAQGVGITAFHLTRPEIGLTQLASAILGE